MKIEGFIWYDSIIEKIEQKHSVYQYEVREIFVNRPQFRFVEKGHRPGENVYSASGQTLAGRYVIVFFAYKKDKHALILSARNMTYAERKKYEKK